MMSNIGNNSIAVRDPVSIIVVIKIMSMTLITLPISFVEYCLL